MEIIVCVKRVADVSETEIEIDRSGRSIRRDDLVYEINEWDNFAVEEAVRLKEKHGGTVTAVTVGGEDDEEILRRALAMGADAGLLLSDPAFAESDSFATARILAAAISSRTCDLVLTGAISGDGGSGRVGGSLAALLGFPAVALATRIEISGKRAEVQREAEGGLERVVEVDLPAVITIQTGINEPRYVSIRGIRKVAGVEIPVQGAGDLGLDGAQVGAAGSRVSLEELFLPPAGERAELLEGTPEEQVAMLVERLRAKGVV